MKSKPNIISKEDILKHCWAAGLGKEQTGDTLRDNGYYINDPEIIAAFVEYDEEYEEYCKEHEKSSACIKGTITLAKIGD